MRAGRAIGIGGAVAAAVALVVVFFLSGDPRPSLARDAPTDEGEASAASSGGEDDRGTETGPAVPTAGALVAARAEVGPETPLADGPRIVVLDDEARPVKDATVSFSAPRRGPDSAGRAAPPPTWSARTNDEGVARAPDPLPPSLAVFAAKEGVGTSGTWIRYAPFDRRELRLVLHPPARVRGTVFGPDLKPVSAVVEFTVLGTPQLEDGQPRRGSSVSTDGEGRFETMLEPGRYSVRASASDAPGIAEFRAHAGAVREISLWSGEAFTASGRLVDESGGVFANGLIHCRPVSSAEEAGLSADLCLHASTDAGGGFTLRLPRPGDWMLAAVGGSSGTYVDGRGGRVSRPRPIEAASAPLPVRVDLASPRVTAALAARRFGSISGRLVVDESDPGADRLIPFAEPAAGPYGVWPQFCASDFHPSAIGAFLRSGTFRFDGLNPSLLYSIRSRDTGRVLATGVAIGTENLELRLDPPVVSEAFVVGEVHSARTGGRLDRFSVQLFREDEPGGWTPVVQEPVDERPDGRFRLTQIAVGRRYSLRVSAPDHGTTIVEPWIAEAPGREVTLTLDRPETLTARVVRPDGAPAPFARVRVVWTHATASRGAVDDATADERGVARFPWRMPGPHRIEAWKRDGHAGPVEVVLATGEEREVVLPLDR